MRALLYVSWSVLPSKSANAVQVVRICNSLVATGALDVVLLARRRPGDPRSSPEVARACGLDGRVDLVLLSSFRPLAGLQILYLAGRRRLMGRRLDFIYSRVLPIFLRHLRVERRVFELHEPPRANWRLKPLVFDRVLRTGGATDIVYISGSLRRIVEREHEAALSIAPVRMHVLHSGGPLVGPVIPEPDGRFAVAYAGRRDKLNTQVVETLARHDPELKIMIFGPDADASDPLAAYPNVELAGWVAPAELAAALARAHVLIAPYARIESADWFSPVKIFDYGAAGRPMLVSDHPSTREIFENGEGGWLLPGCDPEPWCRMVELLKGDPALRASAGLKARSIAENHDMSKRAERIIHLLGADCPLQTGRSPDRA